MNFPPRLESCLNARIVQKDAHKTATFGFLLPPGFTCFNSTLTLLFFLHAVFPRILQSIQYRSPPSFGSLFACCSDLWPSDCFPTDFGSGTGWNLYVCMLCGGQGTLCPRHIGGGQAGNNQWGRPGAGGVPRMWWLLHVTQSKRVLLEVLWSDTDFNSP